MTDTLRRPSLRRDTPPEPAVTSSSEAGPAVATRIRRDLDVESLPDIVFTLSDDGTILDCRGGAPADLALPRERLIGKRLTRCPFGDVGAKFAAALDTTRTSATPVTIDYSLSLETGPAFFEARVARSGDGRSVAVVRNSTRHVETESTMRSVAREYRAMLHAAHVAILLIDPRTGIIVQCNPAGRSLYGVRKGKLAGSTLCALFVDPEAVPDLVSIAGRNAVERDESLHRLRDGQVIRVEMHLSRVVFRGQHVILSVHREVRPPSEGEPEDGESLSLLKATFDAMAEGILVLDPWGKIVKSNRSFARMWKLPPELLRPGRERKALAFVLAQLKNGPALGEEFRSTQKHADGLTSKLVELLDGRFFECVSMPQRIDGEGAGRVWSFRDVTDRMQTEERIRHHAYHDSLTGLPNRKLFQDRLAQDLARSRRAGSNTALFLVDLDRFKTINDTLGHAAGDKLLIEVARRLMSRRRESDTIARLAGDEFVLLVSQLRHKEDAAVVAEQILEVFEEPIQIAEHDLHMSASVGVAIFPDDGDDDASLMQSADVALYRAKELGRDNYQIYEPKLSQRAMERLVMEKDLRKAIRNQEFILQYQPQYDLRTGRLCGVEALVRWVQDKAVVPPDKFISIAEECGLIVPLGRWVLEESARQCVEFNRHSPDPLRLCVNISALQIQRPTFANEVSQIMLAAGLPLKQLVVELTESALMGDPGQGSWAMEQLGQMGVGIALDDFGTGHSSLSLLSHLPVSMIKIDRSFVMNSSRRKTDAAILAAIITMGRALGMKVLAEGIETEAQADLLRAQGCDEVQGYLYSRPVDAEQLIARIRGR